MLKVREFLTDGLLTNELLKQDLEVYELGRKVRSLMWENKSGKTADKIDNWKIISVAEAASLVARRDDLPFSIPDAFVSKFKEQIELHDKLRAKTDDALKANCEIG